ncbi:response regulator transcription factor [Paraburkholderia sp. SARCC-3016]|jgi:two-component system response regulator EvgA|uniref:response regulator transcription factor n=1 Tax=Paraburkholderia sp. SARCC-3016 TaxID=3058611 RepID=UPI002809F414|nr:response regulator transcription factor [Paraburkholderia sp. SARCC-3016]MDQ7978483.1 response regulator transcription factor [Paraburkholderia sp. SARCC-3016]
MTMVMIVDDHPALRLVIKTHLTQVANIEDVVEAGNGQEAVELTRQHLPDLAILDLDIPRINGLDVIPRLRLAHPHIRVMILSGHDTPTFVQRAVRAGAQGFVSKTQDISEIVRGVEAILSGYSVFPVTSGKIVAPLAGEFSEHARLDLLSDKELIVLQMLAKGMSNKLIGEALFISNKTVSSHKTRILQKLGVDTLVDLVDFARRCGIASTQQ